MFCDKNNLTNEDYIETLFIDRLLEFLGFKDNNIKTSLEAINCDELWNINNGITLCTYCHKYIHKSINKLNQI